MKTVRPTAALALLLAALLAAGCVSVPEDAAPQNVQDAIDLETGLPLWLLKGVPSGETHDHGDPAQHMGLSTPNFEEIGWDPLVTDRYGTTATGMGCGGTGVTKEGRKLALVHTISTEVAFIVADVTDPAKPVKLGEYWMPNAVIWDATITPDGKHAIVGAYPPGPIFGRDVTLPPVPSAESAAPAPLEIMFRDACTGEVKSAGPEQWFPWGPGIVMIGLQDPKNPTFEDWVPQPIIGPHSVTAHAIDGKLYATSSVTNLVHDASYFSFFEIVELPTGAGKLVPQSVIQAPGARVGDTGNGHVDVYLAKHPKDNKTYAWLANWDDGMRIYDMSDMRVPVEVSHWADGTAGALHTTYPLPVMWGDRHYVIAGQEVGEPKDLPSGWIYIIDDTDPANPKEVGRWTLPIKPMWKSLNKGGGGLNFSPHYVEVVNQTLFVTNYHGGLWAVDISDPARPKSVGLYVPDKVSPKPFGGKAGGPAIEDVLAGPDGVLTVWGGNSGVHTLRFDATRPMLAPPAWQDVHGK